MQGGVVRVGGGGGDGQPVVVVVMLGMGNAGGVVQGVIQGVHWGTQGVYCRV